MNQNSEHEFESEQNPPASSPIPHAVGWTFIAIYLVIATLMFYDAKTCAEMLCDLAALPALFPFGFLFYWLVDSNYFSYPTSSGLPGDHLRSWYFILPTVVANSVFYYWAGRMLATLAHKAGRVLRR